MSFPIIEVKNLPFNHSPQDLYKLFGEFGNIQEIRTGSTSDLNTRGKAFIVFKNLKNAQLAINKLYGFNYHGRYLIVKLFTPDQYVVHRLTTEMES